MANLSYPINYVGYDPGQHREECETLYARRAGLLHEEKTVDMLILVLPERESRRSIEYKLARASVLSLSDVRGSNRHEVVFSSNEIEYYTGGVL